MLEQIGDLLFGFRRPRFILNTQPMPIGEVPVPSLLSFSLSGPDGAPYTPSVKEGDEVNPGMFLASDGARPTLVCPVKGRVAGIAAAADVRGARQARAVLVEPDASGSAAVFKKLDPEGSDREALWARIAEAGTLTSSWRPRPLAEVIGPQVQVQTLVVSAADREPLQGSMLQVFRERSEDSCKAALMLKAMSGAGKVMLAAPRAVAAEARKICGRHNLPVLELSDYYPDSLEPLAALRAGGGASVRVVSVETALAALDAVREGRVQDKKTVTLIGLGNRVLGNYRVSVGTRIMDLLARAGLHPGEADKIIVGGPMRGYAQYSLDGAVDPGVDAVTVIAAAEIVPWSGEPCVNCGACVSVCPVKLQVQLLGRYAEFGLFDRTEDLGVTNCVECGLCAAVCMSRRPLVQWLRLAKDQVEKKRAERKARETDMCEPPAGSGPGEAAANPGQ